MCGCGGPRERFTHDVILTMLEEDDGNANCHKGNCFRGQNNSSARASRLFSTIPRRPLQGNYVEFANASFVF